TGTFKSYRRADGLPADDLYAIRRGVDGKLWVSSIAGLVRFDPASGAINLFRPDQIDIDRYQAPVVVTSIDVLGEPYRGDRPPESIRRIALDHDQASVSVGFAALSFSGSDRQRLEYKLVGAGERWLDSESAVVELAGLDDGDYTLLLRARNRHGVVSRPIELAIEV